MTTTTPADPLYEVLWGDADDYIPDLGLERIAELIEKMPTEFDVPSTQAHTKSVTATMTFPVVGPIAQDQALEYLLRGAMCVRTLHANLVAARGKIAALQARIDA